MTESPQKTLELDLEKIRVTDSGIQGFYWPVNPFEVSDLYLIVLRNFIAALRDAMNENVMGVDAAIVLYPYFLKEVMSAYDARLLVSRSLRDGYTVFASKRNEWISAFLKGSLPVESNILKQLIDGPPLPKWWRAPFRIIRDLIVSSKQGIIRRSLKSLNYKKDIISITADQLVVMHSKAIPEKVYYKRLHTWFRRPDIKIELGCEKYNEIIDRILKSISESISSKGNPFPENVLLYFKDWLNQGFQLVDYHYRQLTLNSKKVPKRLWADTAGNLWGRILGRYLRNNGGHLTRFAHGAAAGYFSTSIEHGAYELEDCDIYVVFTKNQAASLTKLFTGKDIIQSVVPKIVNVRDNCVRFLLQDNREITNKKKTVMYVASIYLSGDFRAAAIGPMRDVVMLDWEARLLNRVREWGLDVILKPHPVEPLCAPVPSSLNALFGSIVLNERFEKIYHSGDVIIIDHPQTSLFSTLILSGKPFVYLDFGTAKFSEHAYELLAKRCPIVKGWYDENNRGQVDWGQLREAVDTAHQYTNDEFSNYYFQ